MLEHAARLADKRPFTIGLEPLGDCPWFSPDARRVTELALKDALFASQRGAVFMARADTHAAQQECLDHIAANLLQQHPDIYRRGQAGVQPVMQISEKRIALTGEAPLLIAARLVQDDLCLMRKHSDGWRLVAAALCFPSSWSLADKFDRPMAAIHAPVPGFAGAMATRIDRIFDHLQPSTPVERFNWSIYPDDVLRHPHAHGEAAHRREADAATFLRVERQTLTKLPASGDILFTIRIYVDPLDAVKSRPDLAQALRAQLLAMNPDQLAYKGLREQQAAIAARLGEISG